MAKGRDVSSVTVRATTPVTVAPTTFFFVGGLVLLAIKSGMFRAMVTALTTGEKEETPADVRWTVIFKGVTNYLVGLFFIAVTVWITELTAGSQAASMYAIALLLILLITDIEDVTASLQMVGLA